MCLDGEEDSLPGGPGRTLGQVADHMSVWRSGRICDTILRICGSKPMSSMRSASSSTRYVTRRRFVPPPCAVVVVVEVVIVVVVFGGGGGGRGGVGRIDADAEHGE